MMGGFECGVEGQGHLSHLSSALLLFTEHGRGHTWFSFLENWHPPLSSSSVSLSRDQSPEASLAKCPGSVHACQTFIDTPGQRPHPQPRAAHRPQCPVNLTPGEIRAHGHFSRVWGASWVPHTLTRFPPLSLWLPSGPAAMFSLHIWYQYLCRPRPGASAWVSEGCRWHNVRSFHEATEQEPPSCSSSPSPADTVMVNSFLNV